LKILVTGGAGFIGSNLCDFLVSKNHFVICIDNLSTGNTDNIIHLIENPNFKFINGDICDFELCLKTTQDVDIVLHQAALGSVPRSIKDPINSNLVNVNGFLNIIEASKQNNVRKFIYAASSSTYGDHESLPKKEEIIGKPLSPYAVTKYVNELYAEVYSKIYGIETIGLRYFNVFGKRQDPKSTYAAVIPKFIGQFLKGESPVINGDGSYSRDFTYIENVLQMNYLAITTNNSNAINQVYNTAVGDRTTIIKVAEEIRNGLSIYKKEIRKIPILFGPNRQGDIPHSLASIEKAKKLLGYKPLYSFKEGLEASLEWYYNNLNNE